MPRARLVLLALLAVAVVWLGFRAVRAFDQDDNAAGAAAVLSAPDKVTYRLAPVPDGRAAPSPPDDGAPEREGSPQPGTVRDGVHSPGGQLTYRPGTWLTVVDLEGLEPVDGEVQKLDLHAAISRKAAVTASGSVIMRS